MVPRILNGRGLALNLQRCQLMTSMENIGKAIAGIAGGYFNHAEFGLDTSLNPALDGNMALSDEFAPSLFTGRIKLKPRYIVTYYK